VQYCVTITRGDGTVREEAWKIPKRPRDQNQLAKNIVDLPSGETVEGLVGNGKNPHAVALGRIGGPKGGKARARMLTESQRSKIARNAVWKRWMGKK
jgi:hypothetical protein